MDNNKQLKEIHLALSKLSRRMDRLECRFPEQETQQKEPDLPPVQVTASPPPPSPVSPPPPPPPPPPSPVSPPSVSQKKEFLFGANIFAIVGVISLVIGVVAFYFYAITQGWINEIIRVIIVLAAGAALVGIGEYLKNTYTRYASIITGGGIVLFYISVYMANVGYGIIGDIPAYTALLLITLFGGLIAMHRQDPSALVLAVVGGYLTPFILGLPEGNPVIPVAVYLTILNLLVVLGAFFRYSWRGIALAGLLASVVYGLVLTNWYTETPASVFVIAILVNWIVFLSASVVALFRRDVSTNWMDFSLIGLTGIFTLAFLSPILMIHAPEAAGFIVAVLSPVYLGLAVAANVIRPEKEPVRLMYAALFGTFLAVAVPLQLDAEIMPIAWGVLALMFSASALWLRWYRLQIVGFAALGLALFLYFILILSLNPEYPRMFFNQPTLTGLFLAAVVAMQWGSAREVERYKAEHFPASTVLLIISHLVVIGTLSFEFRASHELVFIWTLGTLALVASGSLLKIRPVRIAGFFVWGVAALLLFGSVAERGTESAPFLNGVFWGGILLVAATIAQYFLVRIYEKEEAQNERTILAVAANAVALFVMSAELYYAFAVYTGRLVAERAALQREGVPSDSQRVTQIGEKIRSAADIRTFLLNTLWVVYGAALLSVGFMYRNRYARIGGIFLICVIIAKMYLVDIWSFDILYRFIAFTLLGIFLIAIGFGYNKYKDRIKEML